MSWESEYETEIYKASLYTQESWRLEPYKDGFKFHGENDTHFLKRAGERWVCDCNTFRRKPKGKETCAHTRTKEMLENTNETQSLPINTPQTTWGNQCSLVVAE